MTRDALPNTSPSIEQLHDSSACGGHRASALGKHERLAPRKANRELAFSHREFFDGRAYAAEDFAEIDVLFAGREIVVVVGAGAIVEEEELGVEKEAVPSAIGADVKKEHEVERRARNGEKALAARADELGNFGFTSSFREGHCAVGS